MNNVEIRRKILRILYETYHFNSNDAITINELADELNISVERVKSNVLYLCDPQKELLHLSEVQVAGGKIYTFVKINPAGIDLVEDPNEFNKRFPPKMFFQHVAGDNLQVTIGDNASEVIVGKDIFGVQFGASQNLQEVCVQFIQNSSNDFELEGPPAAQIKLLLNSLIALIESEDFNLGEVQIIKKELEKIEGPPAPNTTTLFCHPEMRARIQAQVNKLIGMSS